MVIDFEELDYRDTAMGAISLRRRMEPRLGMAVYEVKLDDEFLMSSLFTEGEIALARLGLDACAAGPLDVAVGGLGLGYTARAALDHPGLRSLLVIEALQPVIDWHQRGLIPLGKDLCADSRCRMIQGDFFEWAKADAAGPQEGLFHAILLDIDHSPAHTLHPQHRAFYSTQGLRQLALRLHPGGIFALWSNDAPDADFESLMRASFASAASHVVTFFNPLQDRDATNTVYIARQHS